MHDLSIALADISRGASPRGDFVLLVPYPSMSHRYCLILTIIPNLGKDCFYKHQNLDGTKHEFEHGVDEMMARQQSRARSRRNADLIAFSSLAEEINAFADDILNMHLGDELDDLFYGEDEEDDEDEEEEELDDFGEDLDEWEDDDDDVDVELDELWMAQGISAFVGSLYNPPLHFADGVYIA